MAEYIEKKKLVNSLKMWLMDLENDMDKGDYGELCENKGAREAIESCICEAEEQSVADVQPVKRGRWVTVRDDGDSLTICTHCFEAMMFGRTDFCPHCGADMIGENNASSE